MRTSRSVVLGFTAVTALAAGAIAVAASNAEATPSTGLVINEVYGGGGNSGAAFANDFVELADRGATAQDVGGYSVQYLPSSGNGTWQVTPLTGSVPSGGSYLIAEAAGTNGGPALPAGQASGSINMSGSAGTVALVSSTQPLTCSTAAACTSASGVVDLVGYGSTTVVREGTPAPTLDNASSDSRTAAADTDDNATDFTKGAPTPMGSPAAAVTIHDIQGSGWLSPLAGSTVHDVAGVVTGVRTGSSKGYWIQDPTPDDDPATSEGLFVYTGATPTVTPGDSVQVSGTVKEYRPGSDPDAALSITELTSVTTTKVGTAPVPAPQVIHPADVPGQYAPDLGNGDIETTPVTPSRSALDFWESREGMRVEVDDARVVGPSNSYGEQYVTTKPNQLRTYRGGTQLRAENAIPSGRLELIPADGSNPDVDVADVFRGATIGEIDYSNFGGYVLDATTLGTLDRAGLPPTVATPAGNRHLSVATYNVENLAPSDPDTKFAALAHGLVQNLATPDIVALEEIQDNSGSTDDGTVAADQTLTKLTDAIVAAGGPKYRWREIDPVDDHDGGEPGGNIRVAFLFDPKRVSFVDSGSSSVDRSTTATRVVRSHGAVGLSLSPGRIDPTNPVWTDSRKPLVGEFRFRGSDVFVVANHFDSKGGDQSADGPYQYPQRSSEVQRAGQAAAVHNFVSTLLAADKRADVVVVGDLNDYQFSPALRILTTGDAAGSAAPTLTDLITTLPVNQRYTYVYEGISQVLDHILVTPTSVRTQDLRYQVVHLNSEYADQTSDHDPQVVDFIP